MTVDEAREALLVAARTVVYSVDNDARDPMAMRYPFWLASALVELRNALGEYDSQRNATPSAPDSASTPDLGAPDGATAPGAGDDVTKRAHALLRSLIDTYTLELPWSQQAAALEIITDHLNDLAHAAPPAAGPRERSRLEGNAGEPPNAARPTVGGVA